MKKILLILGVLFITIAIHAQEPSVLDVVYFKNGSIIRGLVVEQIPNESLKIATMDGSLFVYKMDEVEKILKEQNLAKRGYFTHESLRFSAYRPGYQGEIEISYGIGVGDLGSSRVIFQTVHGYRFNPYLFVGAGVGVDYNTDIESVFIPVFANVKGYFTRTMVRPYISLDLGYAVATESLELPPKIGYAYTEKIDIGGLLINPAFGASIRVSNRHSVNLAAGYRMQSIPAYVYTTSYGQEVKRQMSGAVNFKIGFMF